MKKHDALAASFRETLQARRERDDIGRDDSSEVVDQPIDTPVEVPARSIPDQAQKLAEGSKQPPPLSPALPGTPPPIVIDETPKRSKGRPPGKKSDKPTYCTTTITIRDDTRTRVKMALLSGKAYPDMSELVEVLLQKWLEEYI